MKRRAMAVVLAGVAVAVAACSGSSAGSGNAGNAGKVAAGAGGAAQAPAAQHGAALDPAGRSASGTATSTDTPLTDSRALIRTATMTVDVARADDVAARADSADAIAESAGGEVDADDRVSGRHASATLRLRVPPTSLLPVLNRLARLGVERSRVSSATDVTERVADVASRVTSARTAIDGLRALYRRSGKVTELLAVENELSSREADLEALEAQQRELARQTALATITLTLHTAATRVVHHHTKATGGIVGGLQRGWHGFVAAAAWVVTAVATALPFLALLVLIALGLRLANVRLPRLRHPGPPPSS